MSGLVIGALIVFFIVGLTSFVFISTSSKKRIENKRLYRKQQMEKRKW